MKCARRLGVPLLLLMLALAGCGGDDEGDGAGEGKVITAKVLTEERPGLTASVGQWMVDIGVVPGDELAYTVEKVIVPSGNTNFRLTNPQSTRHDLTVETENGASANTYRFREGSVWTFIGLLEGERYVFYCSVPGHREAGMEGTIEVDPKLAISDLQAF